MIQVLIFTLFFTLLRAGTVHNYTELTEYVWKPAQACDGFQADFDLKSTIGPWFVVAVIPGKTFSKKHGITCYNVEFSEIDEAGLRWLLNHTAYRTNATMMKSIKGTIIRQRYHSERAFDVWSRAVDDVNGCFQQVLTLDVNNSLIGKALTEDAVMQLHYLESPDKSGPFLLQMLWGDLLSAVIYRRYQGVTFDQMKPVLELMSRVRHISSKPIICSRLQYSAPGAY